jgi:hypothetical protein
LKRYKEPATNWLPALCILDYVQTARLFGTASAAFPGFFLYFISGFINRFFSFFRCFLTRSFCGFLGFVLCILYRTGCAVSWCFYCLFGATCALLVRSSTAAGSGISREGHAAACTYQAGNAQAGKEFFQIFFLHGVPPLSEEVVFDGQG